MYAAREYCFAFNGEEWTVNGRIWINKTNKQQHQQKKKTQEKWDCNNNPMEGGRNL